MEDTYYENLQDSSSKLLALKKHIPKNSEQIYSRVFEKYKFRFLIKYPRKTKYGDFRPSHNYTPPTITVNNNLCATQFHLTFIHEVAHLICWEKYKNTVKPHGQEWFYEFKLLLKESLELNIFSKQIEYAIIKCFFTKRTYNNNCVEIKNALNQSRDNNIITINDIPCNTIFTLKSGKQFRKDKKRRVKYLCTETKSKKQYLVHEIAEILPYNLIN